MDKKDSQAKETIVEEVQKDQTQEEEVIKIPSEDDELSLALKKADEFKDLAQRIQAEFENYRKRNMEAVRQSRNDAINDFIIDLLPVLDNFERALSIIADEKTKAGVELIYKQLLDLLRKYEVEEIKAEGEEFNPDVHDAIAQEEDTEQANKVVAVFRKGYKRKDKILRPTMVKVAK
ncbi:MAG TPA: nucleotide exchange factor GrpE [Clostridia bacterium]|nr:nucleotide exchange factor GrpE [Clostridia bacterium]